MADKPDLEDYQSARRRRGETIRASNKSRAEGKARADEQNAKARAARASLGGDVKGTPLSPFKRGDRGGMFTPTADISGGIGTQIGTRDVLDILASTPSWPSAPEYAPLQPDRPGSAFERALAARYRR